MTDAMADQTPPELDAYLDQLRGELSQPPAADIARRHVAAMAAAVADAPVSRWARYRTAVAAGLAPAPRARPAWAAAALAGLLGMTGALASANVLPDPAQRFVADAAANVGVDLPTPAGGDGEVGTSETHADPDANDHAETVVTVAQDPETSGCERGQAVREAASSKSQADDDVPGRSEEHDPCAEGEGAEVTTSDEHDGDGPPESTPAGVEPGAPESTPAGGAGTESTPGSTAPGRSGGEPANGGAPDEAPTAFNPFARGAGSETDLGEDATGG